MSRDTGLNPREYVIDKFPTWRKPNPIGAFSVNAEKFYENNLKNFRYFRMPESTELPLDLNAGVHFTKKKQESSANEALDQLLEFILDNYAELRASLDKKTENKILQSPLFPVQFVCCGDLLSLIMCTPVEYRKNWIIHITRFKGTHYFCQIENEQMKSDQTQNRLSSWHFKFKQHCLTTSPEDKSNRSTLVDENSELICVFNAHVEGFNLMYGAPMDGIKSQTPFDMNSKLPFEKLKFVELKTGIEIMTEEQMHAFYSYKTRNWWCKSFLVGIEDIIVGCRDNNGLIQSIQELKVSELPKQRKNWSPNQCAQFLVSFLQCVKSLMSRVDCPHTVYELRYNAQHSRITYEIFKGCTEKSFLADYYINFIEKLAKQHVQSNGNV